MKGAVPEEVVAVILVAVDGFRGWEEEDDEEEGNREGRSGSHGGGSEGCLVWLRCSAVLLHSAASPPTPPGTTGASVRRGGAVPSSARTASPSCGRSGEMGKGRLQQRPALIP
jgi:hypothetical protein